MSRGQLARTPANFPRMKHRALRRRIRNGTGMHWEAFDNTGWRIYTVELPAPLYWWQPNETGALKG